jgi:glycosyltransferase involved in cell wall biosynthesis
MACGCLPVAGDIEPVREWIHPPDNGLLVDPGDADALAGALIEALRSNLLANRARTHNLDLIQQRANRGVVMPRAEAFYEVLVTNHV